MRITMFRALGSSAGVVTLLIVGCADMGVPVKYADPLPLGTTLSGDALTTADFRDKTALVVFWTTWAPSCQHALPGLDSLWAELSGAGGFQLVGVDLDLKEDTLIAFLQLHPLSFLITRDVDGEAWQAFDIRSVPTYAIFDQTGHQRWLRIGYQSTDSVAAAVEAVMVDKTVGAGAVQQAASADRAPRPRPFGRDFGRVSVGRGS